MKKIAILGAGLVGLATSACVYIDGDSKNDWSHDRDYAKKPAILGAVVGERSVKITVPSNGCTEKASLDLDVNKDGDTFYIHVDREKQDYCRAYMPDGVEIEYSLQELGIPDGANVVVKNKIKKYAS